MISSRVRAGKDAWARCWGSIRRHPRTRRLTYDLISLVFARDKRLQTLNCGYHPPTCVTLDASLPAEKTDDGVELYALMARQVPDWSGADVLELGCGRGGGSAWLASHCPIASMTAVDFSASSIRYCRRQFRHEKLKFHQADATRLTFPDASFDHIISIELSHCIPEKSRLLDESLRVLRPGGSLLLADFFYTRESSPHALVKTEQAIEASAFRLVHTLPLTDGIIQALEHASTEREALIQKHFPKLFHPIARTFSMTRDSSAFQAFTAGKSVYHLFKLEKPAKI